MKNTIIQELKAILIMIIALTIICISTIILKKNADMIIGAIFMLGAFFLTLPFFKK